MAFSIFDLFKKKKTEKVPQIKNNEIPQLKSLKAVAIPSAKVNTAALNAAKNKAKEQTSQRKTTVVTPSSNKATVVRTTVPTRTASVTAPRNIQTNNRIPELRNPATAVRTVVPALTIQNRMAGRNTLTTANYGTGVKRNTATITQKNSTFKPLTSFQKSIKDKWLDPSYKMSDSEKKEAKKAAQDFIIKARNTAMKDKDYSLLNSDEFRKAQSLYNKSTLLGTLNTGLMAPSQTLINLGNRGASYIADKTGNKSAKDSIEEAYQTARLNDQGAKTQAPLAYGAGKMAGTMLGYTGANSILEGSKLAAANKAIGSTAANTIGKALGVKGTTALAEAIGNVLTGQAADTAMDTVPTVLNNAMEGKYNNDSAGGQLFKDVAENQLTNLMYNMGGEVIPAAIDAMKGTNRIPELNIREKALRTIPEDQIIRKSSDQIAQETNNINSQIKDLYSGKMGSEELIDMGSTPNIYQKFGVPDLRMRMSQSTVEKIAYPEKYFNGKHNLGFESFNQFASQMDNPVAIMKSNSDPENSIIALTDMIDSNGNPVIVPMRINKKGVVDNYNNIPSMYGKSELEKFLNRIESEGKLLYADNKRIAGLSDSGLQLPELKATNDPLLLHNIAEEGKNVNQAAESVNIRGIRGTGEQVKKIISGLSGLSDADKTTASNNMDTISNIFVSLQKKVENGETLSDANVKSLDNYVSYIKRTFGENSDISNAYDELSGMIKSESSDIASSVPKAAADTVANEASTAAESAGKTGDTLVKPTESTFAKWHTSMNDADQSLENYKSGLKDNLQYTDGSADYNSGVKEVNKAVESIQNKIRQGIIPSDDDLSALDDAISRNKDILSGAKMTTEQAVDGVGGWKDVREFLKGRKFYLTKEGAHNLGYKSVADANREWSQFGSGIVFTGDAQNPGIDTAIAEVQEQFPGMFDNVTRPDELLDAFRTLKKGPKTVTVNMDNTMGQQLDDISNYIHNTVTNMRGMSAADTVSDATKSASDTMSSNGPKVTPSDEIPFYDTTKEAYTDSEGNIIPETKPGQKTSKVVTNTAATDKVLSQDVADGTINPNDYNYDVHNQDNAVSRAQQRVAENADQLYDDYMSGEMRKVRNNGVYDDEDSANMMELARHYSTEARNATDEASKATNRIKSNRILMELRKNATKAGQYNSILQQYANTADGLALKGNGIVADGAENWAKQNPKAASDIETLSKQIEGALNRHNAQEVFANGNQAEIEALRSQITDEIQNILKKHDRSTRKALKGLSEDAISEILNAKQAKEIETTLDFFASSGSTGVKESTMQTVEDLMSEAQKYGPNSKQRVTLEGQAYAAIANDIGRKGGTFKDKFDALRYLNMLCSPKTHAKNVANNIIFSNAIMGTKDNLAAVIEAGVDRANKALGGSGIARTKSVLNPLSETDRSLISSCYKDASDSAFRQLDGGNKYYDVGRSIEDAIPAFSQDNWLGRFMNNWSNFNTNALDKEDQMTMIQKYTTSLAGYLKANGKDVSILTSTADADKQFMEGARKYAISQAEEAAFHQSGSFGSTAAKFGKFNNDLESASFENGDPNYAARALGYAGNIVVPFKKTPANILATALSYSPANAVKNLTSDIYHLRKGTINASQFIDEVSKTATGTSLVALGAILAHEGIIGIDYLDDKSQAKLKSATGNTGAVVHIGKFNMKLGDFSSEAIPLIEGAVAYATKEKNNLKGLNDNGTVILNSIVSGLSATADAVTETTMLSGIADILNSVKYSDGTSDMWARLGTSIAGNLAGQMIPALSNVAEKTGDALKRATYTGKSGIEGVIGSEAKYLQSRIPGLGNKLEPAIDVWGNEVSNFGGNSAGRLGYTGLSPATLTNNTADAIDNEIERLYNVTSDATVNPQMQQSEAKFNTNDGAKQLTPSEWTQYQKQKGTLQHQLVTDFINSDTYKSMNDNDRADVIGKLFGYAKTSTQVKFGSKSTSAQKLDEAYAENGSQGVIDAIIQKNEDKKSSDQEKKVIDALTSGNVSAKDIDNLTIDDINNLTGQSSSASGSAESSSGASSTGTSIPSLNSDTSKSDAYKVAEYQKKVTDKQKSETLAALKTGKVTSSDIEGLNITQDAKVAAYKKAFDIEGDNNGSLKLSEIRKGVKSLDNLSAKQKEQLYAEIKPDAKTDLYGKKISGGKTAAELYGVSTGEEKEEEPKAPAVTNAADFEKSYGGTGDPTEIAQAIKQNHLSQKEKDKAYQALLDTSALGKQETAGYSVAKSKGISTSEYFEAREGSNDLAKQKTGKNNGQVSKKEANDYLSTRNDLSDSEKEKLFYALVPNAKGGYTGKTTGDSGSTGSSSGNIPSLGSTGRSSGRSASASTSTAVSSGAIPSLNTGVTTGTPYISPNINNRSTVVTLADGSKVTKSEYNDMVSSYKGYINNNKDINTLLGKSGVTDLFTSIPSLPSLAQTGKRAYMSNATMGMFGGQQIPSLGSYSQAYAQTGSSNGFEQTASQYGLNLSELANLSGRIGTMSAPELQNYLNYRTDLTDGQKKLWGAILGNATNNLSAVLQNILKNYYQKGGVA